MLRYSSSKYTKSKYLSVNSTLIISRRDIDRIAGIGKGRTGEKARWKLIPGCRAITEPHYIIRYIISDPVVTRNYDSRAKHFADWNHFFFGFVDILERTPRKIRRRGLFVARRRRCGRRKRVGGTWEGDLHRKREKERDDLWRRFFPIRRQVARHVSKSMVVMIPNRRSCVSHVWRERWSTRKCLTLFYSNYLQHSPLLPSSPSTQIISGNSVISWHRRM